MHVVRTTVCAYDDCVLNTKLKAHEIQAELER